MKKGWEYKKLGEVAIFSRGLTYSKKDEVVFSDNIVLRSNNVDLVSGQIIFDELKYLSNDFCIPNEKKVKKGSLLMCMSNGSKIHLGKVALVKEDYGYAFGGFMSLVTPFKDIDSKFFYYTLITPTYKQYIKSLSEGANINNLKIKDLENYVIPIPPLSEQKGIVEYLDSSFAKIDKLKENASKNLEEAKALFQSALKDALEPKEGWEEKTMDEVCILSQGLAINSKTKHLLVEKSSIPLLRIKDMKDGTREIFVDDKNYPPKCLAHPDELIYTRTGTLGLIFTGMFGIVHNNCFKIKLDEKILNKYYYMYFVGSDNFRNMILSIASRAAQPDITHKLFKVQKIQFPTLSEQQSIVSFLDSLNEKLNTLQQNYSHICDECDALKQAILRQVFE